MRIPEWCDRLAEKTALRARSQTPAGDREVLRRRLRRRLRREGGTANNLSVAEKESEAISIG
jgi:hypothetical protein